MRLLLPFLLIAASAFASAHAAEGEAHLVTVHSPQPIARALDDMPRFHAQVTRADRLIERDWQEVLAGDAGEVIVQQKRDPSQIRWQHYEVKARGQLDVTPVPANIPEPPVAFMVLGGMALVSFARRKI